MCQTVKPGLEEMDVYDKRPQKCSSFIAYVSNSHKAMLGEEISTYLPTKHPLIAF